MRKSDLKKIIKPIVKECIQESLLEDGILSKVIAEVATGLSPTSTIVEQVQAEKEKPQKTSLSNKRESEGLANLKEQRQKMLDAIGRDTMNGVNIFEGTEPLSTAGGGSTPHSPLNGVDPKDPGVDISDLAGIYGDTWKVIKNG